MGHCISYRSFDETTSKEEIFAYCNEEAIENGDYHGGLYCGIKYFNCEPLANKDAAEAYIEERDKDFYGNYAVRYLSYPDSLTSKKLEELNARDREIYNKLCKAEAEKHFKDVKSAFIGCKKCGSKISTEYLRGNYCPVCNNDMRPETKLKQIDALKNKRYAIEEQIKAETKKIQEKNVKRAKIKWLVKFEYHV